MAHSGRLADDRLPRWDFAGLGREVIIVGFTLGVWQFVKRRWKTVRPPVLSRSSAAIERHLTRGLAVLLFLVALLGIYERGTKTGSLQRRDERSRVPLFLRPRRMRSRPLRCRSLPGRANRQELLRAGLSQRQWSPAHHLPHASAETLSLSMLI